MMIIMIMIFLLYRPIERLLRYHGSLEGGIGLVIGAGKVLSLINCDNMYDTTLSVVVPSTTNVHTTIRWNSKSSMLCHQGPRYLHDALHCIDYISSIL
jgi:hypothetical protein